MVASHVGGFRGARISSLPARDEIRASLKTPAWEANMMVERVNRSSRCYSRSKKIIFVAKYRIQNNVIWRFLLYMLLFWKKKKMWNSYINREFKLHVYGKRRYVQVENFSK